MPPKSLSRSLEQLHRVAARLHSCGDTGWAGVLEKAATQMTDRYTAKETLFEVGGWCHSRALGDTVAAMTFADWTAELEELHDRCAAAFNELERMPPDRPL